MVVTLVMVAAVVVRVSSKGSNSIRSSSVLYVTP